MLAILITISNGQTLCLVPPTPALWPYHPSAAFEARHNCSAHRCYFDIFSATSGASASASRDEPAAIDLFPPGCAEFAPNPKAPLQRTPSVHELKVLR